MEFWEMWMLMGVGVGKGAYLKETVLESSVIRGKWDRDPSQKPREECAPRREWSVNGY